MKSNIPILGIAVGVLFLSTNSSNLSLELQYMIAVVSLLLTIAEVLKTTQKILYAISVGNYKVSCIKGCESDVGKFIDMTSFTQKRFEKYLLGSLSSISSGFTLGAFSILILLLANPVSINTDTVATITRYTLMVFGLSFITIFLNSTLSNIETHFENEYQKLFLLYKTVNVAEEATGLLKEVYKDYKELREDAVNIGEALKKSEKTAEEAINIAKDAIKYAAQNDEKEDIHARQ